MAPQDPRKEKCTDVLGKQTTQSHRLWKTKLWWSLFRRGCGKC